MADDKSQAGIKIITTNRQARFRYEILSTMEAGLVLTGTEVKSLRDGKCNLKEGYARIDKEEAWLIGVHIPEYTEGNRFNHEPTRTRKLLLSKRQIRHLSEATQQDGLTLVPLRVYFKGRVAKVEIGVGRGKKLYDKRETIAKRETDRRMRQELHRRR
jgi:SsrA-binding protein